MSYDPTDNPNFSREQYSGALINNNTEELRILKRQRDIVLHKDKKMQSLEQQLEQIKSLLAKGGINV
jgi:hypothetical protein